MRVYMTSNYSPRAAYVTSADSPRKIHYIQVMMDASMLQEIERLAIAARENRSVIIRQLIRAGLDQVQNQKTNV